jgi:phage terminase small subunit
LKLCSELGFTPSARARLVGDPPPDDDEDAAIEREFFGGK